MKRQGCQCNYCADIYKARRNRSAYAGQTENEKRLTAEKAEPKDFLSMTVTDKNDNDPR